MAQIGEDVVGGKEGGGGWSYISTVDPRLSGT